MTIKSLEYLIFITKLIVTLKNNWWGLWCWLWGFNKLKSKILYFCHLNT